jgi:hypothetical protein
MRQGQKIGQNSSLTQHYYIQVSMLNEKNGHSYLFGEYHWWFLAKISSILVTHLYRGSPGSCGLVWRGWHPIDIGEVSRKIQALLLFLLLNLMPGTWRVFIHWRGSFYNKSQTQSSLQASTKQRARSRQTCCCWSHQKVICIRHSLRFWKVLWAAIWLNAHTACWFFNLFLHKDPSARTSVAFMMNLPCGRVADHSVYSFIYTRGRISVQHVIDADIRIAIDAPAEKDLVFRKLINIIYSLPLDI